MSETQESLGKRLGRFAVLFGVVFVATAVVVITQRLSQDSLALLVGLSCGVAAMLPTLVLGVLVWRREMMRQTTSRMPNVMPPVVIVTPQALPGYGVQQPAFGDAGLAWPWNNAQQQARTFTIVGGEE